MNSEQIMMVVDDLKQSFRRQVEFMHGMPFADTKVTMPPDEVWQRYAKAAIDANVPLAGYTHVASHFVRTANAPFFQARVNDWMQECFGPAVAADLKERPHRFLEEALELAQSAGTTKAEVLQLVEYVFNRPKGDPRQEVGGTMVTLAALCTALDVNMAGAAEDELARVSTPEMVAKLRAKNAAKDPNSPLPGFAPQPLANTRTLAEELATAIGAVVNGPRKLFVVMGNDFPDAVFSTEQRAESYIAEKRAEANSRGARIYWRHYAFMLDRGEPATDETDYKALFEACAEARDVAGFIGSVPECIAFQAAEIQALVDLLCLADEAIVAEHGCFPLDRTNDHERFMNEAALAVRAVTGEDYAARKARAATALASYKAQETAR